MKNTNTGMLFKCIAWAVFGALIGAVTVASVAFLYKAFILAKAGVSPDALPIARMLIDVMELHRFALYGAVSGGVLAAVVVYFRYAAHGNDENRQPFVTAPDPDAMIRQMRKQRAERYLRERQAERTRAGAGEEVR